MRLGGARLRTALRTNSLELELERAAGTLWVDALDAEPLCTAAFSGDQLNLRLSDTQQIGDELCALGVGPPAKRWSRDTHCQSIAVTSGNRGSPGAWVDTNSQHNSARGAVFVIGVEQVFGHGRLLYGHA